MNNIVSNTNGHTFKGAGIGRCRNSLMFRYCHLTKNRLATE